jgi:hypothetical protein
MTDTPAPAPAITDAQRAELQRDLQVIDAELDPLERDRSIALRQAAEPFEVRIEELNAERELLLERYGVEVAGSCDHCKRLLLHGDKGHSVADDPGIMWCESCAPTWADMWQQYEDLTPEAFEDPDDYQIAVNTIRSHLDAGDGDKKHVWAL